MGAVRSHEEMFGGGGMSQGPQVEYGLDMEGQYLRQTISGFLKINVLRHVH